MKKLIALVALLFTVMISSTAAAADWVWIYSDDERTIYIDNNSIRRDRNYSGYVFRAFVKWNYSNAGRERMINNWRTSGHQLPRGIYNLSHAVELLYFRAGDGIKYIGDKECVYYTHDGIVIPDMGFSFSELRWQIIKPGTVAEAEYDAIRARVPN